MDNKIYSFVFFFLLIILYPGTGIAGQFTVQDTTKQDTVKTDKPVFTNVDVVVEYDWSEPEKNNGVDVFVKKESGKISAVIMVKTDVRRCEVELISGVVVKIIDPKTKKLLKTYKGGKK
jgi:hypothetical protein